MKRRMAQLPLHTGSAPPWLFRRMAKLAGAVTMAVVDEYGPDEMLRRLADPWWFQAFGCVLGFDWHSSGLTTVTCGALKEAARAAGGDLGILVAGGKGGTSRKTPGEIATASDRYAIASGEKLVYASRMSAKVDSAALQDGYQLYHHAFFFTPRGQWCVVQQGMNTGERLARRYHWLGESVDDFVSEPHAAIRDLAAPRPRGPRQLLLNMVAAEAGTNREASAVLVRENPDRLLEEIKRWTEGPTLFAPRHHRVLPADVNLPRLRKLLINAHEQHPRDFEALLGGRGVGAATIRSLALLAELIYEAPASRRDPAVAAAPAASTAEMPGDGHGLRRWADYSYAHGGKDGTPFPVDRETYDRNIGLLTEALRKARLGENDRVEALKRLARHAG
jgi:uncharacterized protein